MRKPALSLLCSAIALSAATALAQNDDGSAAASAAGCGICGSFFLFFFLAIVALNIAILVWVARDAKARGLGQWRSLDAVGPVHRHRRPHRYYLLARPQGNLIVCPNCGNKRSAGSREMPQIAEPERTEHHAQSTARPGDMARHSSAFRCARGGRFFPPAFTPGRRAASSTALDRLRPAIHITDFTGIPRRAIADTARYWCRTHHCSALFGGSGSEDTASPKGLALSFRRIRSCRRSVPMGTRDPVP